MKNLFTVALLFLASIAFGQVIEVTTSSGTQLINLDEIKFAVTQGTGTVLIQGNRLQQTTVTDSLGSIVSKAGGRLCRFTDSKDNKEKAVNYNFVTKVIENSGGKAIILTSNIAFSFVADESQATIQSRLNVPFPIAGLASDTTDASGDLLITVAAMPDTTYSATVAPGGTVDYSFSVHTKTTTSFKVRTYEPTTGAALGSGVSVSYNYHVKDY